jgi:hypothetical protein
LPKTGIIGIYQPDFRRQQHAGIEVIHTNCGREGAPLLVPGLF